MIHIIFDCCLCRSSATVEVTDIAELYDWYMPPDWHVHAASNGNPAMFCPKHPPDKECQK